MVSGTDTKPTLTRQKRCPLLRSSALTRPSGRVLAAYTVSPETSTPPATIPMSRLDHLTAPLSTSTAYTFRSTPPPYRVPWSRVSSPVKRRPARLDQTWAGALAEPVDGGGVFGGGGAWKHAALTLPRRRTRLNAP
jgi:hypothetical protein